MSLNWLAVIYYLLVWGAARIRGTYRRWRQPLLRGQEWFFNVHVQPDFYAGAGRKILQEYRMRIFISWAIEAPVTTALFVSGHVQYVSFLILAMAAFIHVFQVFSVDRAERQARQFAVEEAERPVAALALSLKARRLRDYTNFKVELVIVFCLVSAVAVLMRYYFSTSPDHHNLRLVFAAPAFWLYAQIGFLLAKVVVVAWRTPIPQSHMEEHLAAREETRKLYLKACDRARVLLSLAILCWPILLSVPRARLGRASTIWLTAFLMLAVVLGVWQEIRRKQVLAVTLRAQPVKLPDLLGESGALRWPVCYQPSIPMIAPKGMRGYSLNLANQLTQLGAAYVVGLVALFALLRMFH